MTLHLEAPPSLSAAESVLDIALKHHLLGAIDPVSLGKILASCTVRSFGQNRPILKSGAPPSHVLFLLAGKMRVYYRHESGKEILIKLFRAPALMCEMEILADIPVMPNARSISPIRVLYMPAETFRQLVAGSHIFAKKLIADLATRLCVASDRQRALAFGDVEHRLSSLLMDYARLSGRAHPSGLLLDIAITQDSMARDLAVTRKVINEVLGKLKAQGVLSKSKGRYILLNPDELARRCSAGLTVTHSAGAEVRSLMLAQRGHVDGAPSPLPEIANEQAVGA